jgi:AGZA family xanthine/uracil permease-like MFS transporter
VRRLRLSGGQGLTTALKLDIRSALAFGLVPILFSFTFVDLFDNIGTLIGVSRKAKLLDDSGQLPRIGRALVADSVGTMFGALMATSTVTSYIESAAGVSEGGRTGLTAVVVGSCSSSRWRSHRSSDSSRPRRPHLR